MFAQLTQRLHAKRDDDAIAARALAREAKFYANLLSNKLEQLNICYRYRKSEKDLIERGVQKVKFNLAVTQEEALWLRIDTSPRRFPRGVSLAHIDAETVLSDLSVSAGRPVHFRKSDNGAWLMIERESGVFGIRAHIDIADMVKAWPDNNAILQVPLGLAANRKLIFRSIDEFPHALIGGATKSGKTTLLHAWICALLLRHKPSELQIVMIDLKGGVEFTRYKELPHVWTYEGKDETTLHGFVKDREKVIPVLEVLRWEMDRRLALYEQAGGVQHIAMWNYRHRRNPMPHIVIFIDELASLMLEPDLKKDAERLLSDIGARGRAPGLHLVIATQRPEVSVVSGRIKGNLDARFGFRVPDNASSMVVMDDTSAAQFPDGTPRGRFIFKFGNDRREVQAPWIGPNKIRSIVNAILDGDGETQLEAARWDPEDIFRVALQEFGGAFSIQKMFDRLKGKGVSNKYLRQLGMDYIGQLIEIDGVTYELRDSDAVFEPRRLVEVSGQPMADSEGHDHGDMEGVVSPATQTAIVLASESRPATQTESPATQTRAPETAPATQEPRDFTTIEGVLAFAVEHLGGNLQNRELHRLFLGISSRELSSLLSEYDNTTVDVNGELYFCEPSAGRVPRRLVKI